MKITRALGLIIAVLVTFQFASAEVHINLSPDELRTEFQRLIDVDVLPKVIARSQQDLPQDAAVEFVGSLISFKSNFVRFADTLCQGANETCLIARYTEGVELARNLRWIPEVDSTQLALPTRPFKRAEEFCQFESTIETFECLDNILTQKENRLLQTKNPMLAELGVRMAKDYAVFASYIDHTEGEDHAKSYYWNLDYNLQYLEDRLSDY